MMVSRDKQHKYSWPKLLVRKWLNLKTKPYEFHADEIFQDQLIERRRSLSDESVSSRKSFTGKLLNKTRESFKRVRVETDLSKVSDVQNLRVFVGTWNVGGKPPCNDINLDEWLHASSSPSDIYVLGFQEIVPLKAGNVLGAEDNGPAAKWVAFIRQILNNNKSRRSSFFSSSWDESRDSTESDCSLDSDFEFWKPQENSIPSQRRSFHASKPKGEAKTSPLKWKQKSSLPDHLSLGRLINAGDSNASLRSVSSEDESDLNGEDSPFTILDSPMSHILLSDICISGEMNNSSQPKYCLAASKQKVGIFLCVWVRSDLIQHVQDIKVSCVSRGLMGYLGNKGSISISMLIHQTSFCFVCTHLTSGEKGVDEQSRNSDVMGILKKTHFPQAWKFSVNKTPESILDHDRVIWLGDLNYRLALPYVDSKTLIEKNDWEALLEKDQLQIQQKAGHIFHGWNEGKIHFPPTYKYCKNSDYYLGESLIPRAKPRTPAWCDRILWFGKGLRQLCYVRGESTFSDHRPVSSVFMADVEILNRSKLRKVLLSSGARFQVEELLRWPRR